MTQKLPKVNGGGASGVVAEVAIKTDWERLLLAAAGGTEYGPRPAREGWEGLPVIKPGFGTDAA